jgi:hypothetical protein
MLFFTRGAPDNIGERKRLLRDAVIAGAGMTRPGRSSTGRTTRYAPTVPGADKLG